MSSDRSVPTRQRLVTAAAELFRRQGYAATGIKSILSAADAPYGSLYHFFPGGKAELGRAVVDEGGAAYLALVETYFRDDVEPVVATREFFADGVMLLESTGFADACPIATMAGEVADTHEELRRAAAAAFRSWTAALERPPRPPRRRPHRSRRDRDRDVLPHRGCLPALSHHPVLGAAAGRRPPCGRHRGRGAHIERRRTAPHSTLKRSERHAGGTRRLAPVRAALSPRRRSGPPWPGARTPGSTGARRSPPR